MANRSRAKGKRGEQRVARVFRDAGHNVLPLQRNHGDVADMLVSGRYYVDSKAREQQRLIEWMPALEAITPPSTVPILAFTLGGRWYGAVPLGPLAELLPR